MCFSAYGGRVGGLFVDSRIKICLDQSKGWYMKLLIWNMEYWKNFSKLGWKEKCIYTLSNIIREKNIDFALLQETNPFKLFNIEYESEKPYRYENIEYENKSIFYHELYNELPRKYRKTPWGNAIILTKEFGSYNCSIEYNDTNYYDGRNGLMCYTFEFKEGKITFINFYNKLNKGIYTMLDKYHYDIKKDIEHIIEKNNNIIVFAGDFNTGSNNDDKTHIDRYYDLCNKLDKFVDISNGEPKCNQNTTYWYNWRRKEFFLRNDFCFVNDKKYIQRCYVEFMNNNDWEEENGVKRWRGLSDHCPIIVAF